MSERTLRSELFAASLFITENRSSWKRPSPGWPAHVWSVCCADAFLFIYLFISRLSATPLQRQEERINQCLRGGPSGWRAPRVSSQLWAEMLKPLRNYTRLGSVRKRRKEQEEWRKKMQSTRPLGLLLDHLANTLINMVFPSPPPRLHTRTHTLCVALAAAHLSSQLCLPPLVLISSAHWHLHDNISALSEATEMVSF